MTSSAFQGTSLSPSQGTFTQIAAGANRLRVHQIRLIDDNDDFAGVVGLWISDINIVKGKGEMCEEGADRVIRGRRQITTHSFLIQDS